MPTRKNSEQTKAPWIDGVRPTRLKMGRNPRNLAHSKISTAKIYSKKLLCQRLLFLFLWPLKSFVITKHEIIYHKNLHKKICSAKVFCFLFLQPLKSFVITKHEDNICFKNLLQKMYSVKVCYCSISNTSEVSVVAV